MSPQSILTSNNIGFWRSVGLGAPLLCLLMGDFITLSKPSKDGSGLLMSAEIYRLVIFGGIYFLSVWMIYLRRVDFLSLMRGHWLYILFLAYAFSSFLWSANPAKTLVTSGHLLGHYCVAMAGLLMFRGNEVSLIRVYCMFSYFFIPACLATALFFPERNIHSETGRWMALTWNPNSLGTAAMICVWANASYLLFAEKLLMRLWVLMIIGMSFVLLVGAGSITSLSLSALIVAGVMVFYWFANSRDNMSAIFKISYTALLVFGVAGYFYATQPDLFVADRALGAVGRDSNLTGRTTLWALADAAIAERPLLGWSFDALQSLPSRYSMRYNQFHNGYLDLLVRGGAVGLAFILIFALTIAVRIIRVASVKKRMAASFGILFVAIMVHNTTETSFASAPNPLWLLFTFLYIGISPRIFKWYETGVLEKATILWVGKAAKAKSGPEEGFDPQPQTREAPGARNDARFRGPPGIFPVRR